MIYDDFSQPISWMTTPRNATREIAEEMAQLRNAMRQVASELRMNKALIQDAMARLEEMNNGHHVAPFCGLPTMHESDDAAEKLEKFLLTNPGHESLPSEDEDTDPDEVPPIYSREMKDPNLLEENWLDPVWIEGDGYSGKVPREIEEYLEFDCASKYHLALPCLGFYHIVIILTELNRSLLHDWLHQEHLLAVQSQRASEGRR